MLPMENSPFFMPKLLFWGLKFSVFYFAWLEIYLSCLNHITIFRFFTNIHTLKCLAIFMSIRHEHDINQAATLVVFIWWVSRSSIGKDISALRSSFERPQRTQLSMFPQRLTIVLMFAWTWIILNDVRWKHRRTVKHLTGCKEIVASFYFFFFFFTLTASRLPPLSRFESKKQKMLMRSFLISVTVK